MTPARELKLHYVARRFPMHLVRPARNKVMVAAVAAFTLLGAVHSALGADYVVRSVASGTSSSSVSLDGWNNCHSTQYPYDWWHGLAYSVNTNTATRQVTVNYLDFYGGDTDPDPPYTVPPALETIWSADSWIYSSTDAYKFGDLSAFGGQQFDSYDITLWMYEVINYPANDYVLVHSKFGETDGGDVSGYCHSGSYLYFDPPN
jgi:hypothetical protein